MVGSAGCAAQLFTLPTQQTRGSSAAQIGGVCDSFYPLLHLQVTIYRKIDDVARWHSTPGGCLVITQVRAVPAAVPRARRRSIGGEPVAGVVGASSFPTPACAATRPVMLPLRPCRPA